MSVVDWVVRWPCWAWYVATVPFTAAAAAVLSSFYLMVQGEFWEPFWYGMALGVPAQWYGLWRHKRETDRQTGKAEMER